MPFRCAWIIRNHSTATIGPFGEARCSGADASRPEARHRLSGLRGSSRRGAAAGTLCPPRDSGVLTRRDVPLRVRWRPAGSAATRRRCEQGGRTGRGAARRLARVARRAVGRRGGPLRLPMCRAGWSSGAADQAERDGRQAEVCSVVRGEIDAWCHTVVRPAGQPCPGVRPGEGDEQTSERAGDKYEQGEEGYSSSLLGWLCERCHGRGCGFHDRGSTLSRLGMVMWDGTPSGGARIYRRASQLGS